MKVWLSPNGEKFPIPSEADFDQEKHRLQSIVEIQKSLGREIIVVMGIGFVGAVMAAIVADSVDERGISTKFVIWMQRPSVRSYWKIPLINRGESPIKADDSEISLLWSSSTIFIFSGKWVVILIGEALAASVLISYTRA